MKKTSLLYILYALSVVISLTFVLKIWGSQRTEVVFIEERVWDEKCTVLASQYQKNQVVEYELQVSDCSGSVGWNRCFITIIAYEIELNSKRSRSIGVASSCTQLE